MGLFKKKETASEPTCSCGGACSGGEDRNQGARVKVLGPGCKSCRALHESAVAALGAENVDYVTDMAEIAATGIMSFPALMVDGKVVSAGKALSAEEVSVLVRR